MTNEGEGTDYDQMPQAVSLSQEMMASIKCFQNYFTIIVPGENTAGMKINYDELHKGIKGDLIAKCVSGNQLALQSFVESLRE